MFGEGAIIIYIFFSITRIMLWMKPKAFQHYITVQGFLSVCVGVCVCVCVWKGGGCVGMRGSE